MKFRVVIPARWGSSRLPGKPLAVLAGQPMIYHVHRLALDAGATEVLVATDDDRIRLACEAFGAMVEMTSIEHASGTDRLAEVAKRRSFAPRDIVVNLQGDEPLMPPALVAQVAALLEHTPQADIATLSTPITRREDYLDPNVVKVVSRDDGAALYFSRAPIPWHRDGAGADISSQQAFLGAQRHLGLYAYRSEALQGIAALPASPLEIAEKLEQLRAMQAGFRIQVAVASVLPGPGVDTPADLERAGRLLMQENER